MKNKSKKVTTFILISLIIVLTFNPVSSKNTITIDDQIDQEQDIITGVDYVYSNHWTAQSFKPNGQLLTRIQLFIAKIGDITSDLEIILKDALTGQNITTSTVSSSEIPTSNPDWVEFDFIDINVTQENVYYIICKTDNGNPSNSYTWFESSNNPYDRGTKYSSDDNGITWEQNPDTDFCFRTYTKKAELEIQYITGGFGWNIYYGIKNTGTFGIKDINVYISFSGGFILSGGAYNDTIDQIIPPGEIYEDNIYPVIGLGPTTITITVTCANTPTISETRSAFLFLFSVYIHP